MDFEHEAALSFGVLPGTLKLVSSLFLNSLEMRKLNI